MFDIGMDVICIEGSESFEPHPHVVKDQVYRIRAMMDIPDCGGLTLWFEELPGEVGGWIDAGDLEYSTGFGALWFRPLSRDDIAVFEKLRHPSPAKETIDA